MILVTFLLGCGGGQGPGPTLALTHSAPAIQRDPEALEASLGGLAVFQVVATGVGPLTCQWYKDGIAVPGAQGDVLVLGPLEREAEGAYSVLVFNGAGEVWSKAAPLSLRRPPSFVTLPKEALSEGGGGTYLSAEVDGYPQPVFQWFRDGIPLPGATHPRLELSSAEAQGEGSFHLTASNALGRIESQAITFGPRLAPPVILRDLRNLMALPGTPARFEIEVDPSSAPSFQWRKDGVNLPGETAAALVIPSVAPGNEGGYSVRITLVDRPAVLSRTATLRVVDRILRVTSPADNGPDSLRAAVTFANTQAGTTGIFIEGNPPPTNFDVRIKIPARTLDLQSALPPLLRDMVIEGPGDGEVVLQCAGGFRPFFVVSGRIELADLTISGGFAKGGDSWGGGGGAGMGGALFVDGGEVLLDRMIFKQNRAVGGSSFPAVSGLRGGGAGCSGNAPLGGAGGPGAPFCGLPGPGELLATPQAVALGGDAQTVGDCYGDGAGGGAATGATALNWGGTGGWGAGGGFAVAPGIGGEGGGNNLGSEWFAGGGGGILDASNPAPAFGAGGLWGGSGDRYGQGGGGAGLGGAIFLRRGQISRMMNCQFFSNEAIAGSGSPTPEDGAHAMAKGGAIYIYPKPYPFPVNGITPVETTCGGDDLVYPSSVLKAQRYRNNVAKGALADPSNDNPNFYLAICGQAPIIIRDPLSQKAMRIQR